MKNRKKLARANLCRVYLHIHGFITDGENGRIHYKIMKWQKNNKVSISEAQLDSADFIYDDNAKEEEESKVEGITLTEEVLLTCGFEYINPDNKAIGMLSPDDGRGNRNRIMYFDSNFRMILNTWNYMPINYIHEVQNLYFAIANKELNIQL